MAKRIIIECDLSKQEYDPDQTVTITFKKKGKDKGRSYDLSPESAAKLEQQLVAGSTLDKDWIFSPAVGRAVLRAGTAPKTLADLDDGDAAIVANKKAELREAGILPEKDAVSEVTAIEGGSSDCIHINKGRIQTTLRNGKRFVFRLCQECRARVPEMTAADKKAYAAGKIIDDDIRIRDLETEE